MKGDPPVGVIGGVGPQATAYFLDMVVRLTDAARDQDHLDLVVLNHATIPDRTAFIVGESDEDPGPVMAEDARRLERFGVQFLVLPCNTAHHFTDEVAGAVTVPLLNIVEETVAETRRRVPGLGTVGLLATTGTARAAVYQREAERHGLTCLLPDDDDQARVMRIIYEQVKAGRPVDVDTFHDVVEGLRRRGAEVVVLGCTELSVVAADHDLLADRTLVDSLDVLARRTIERAGHRVREA
ncbi:aspartate/glutamate racemase family protein [Cellulomonas carbonis]|uniref:Aspartate racemase n=1 Tax=Cellulomonas carbonis T26 TaxID=947969 RepID=A0A0A0BZD0_9CELL|nr:amino acid racemase [Cellulomonas carbonis]KGM12549.1 aspartate racemase [Cellulomonas carbonis T26]GGB93532.1 aspartate racemase [Cellulomonas carbonis]